MFYCKFVEKNGSVKTQTNNTNNVNFQMEWEKLIEFKISVHFFASIWKFNFFYCIESLKLDSLYVKKTCKTSYAGA